MLDKTFSANIKKVANGDGTKKYARCLAKELRSVAAELGHRYRFNDCVKRYGREKVALCVASTMATEYGYESYQRSWAAEVMALWQNQVPRSTIESKINIHPAILADASDMFRRISQK